MTLLFRAVRLMLAILLTAHLPPSAADQFSDIVNGKQPGFLFPWTTGQTFYFSDTLNVTFQSPIADPRILTLCTETDDLTKVAIVESHTFLPPVGDRWFLAHLNIVAKHLCLFQLGDHDTGRAAVGGATGAFFYIKQETRAATTLGTSVTFPATSATPSISSTTTSSALSTTTKGSDALQESAPASTSTSSGDTPGSSGISTGAIVGIAIAASVVIIGVILMVFALWRRRRKAKAQEGTVGAGSLGIGTKNEPSGSNSDPPQPPPYKPNLAPAGELDASRPLSEMPDSRNYQHHELSA